jgi:hypothetical protein
MVEKTNWEWEEVEVTCGLVGRDLRGGNEIAHLNDKWGAESEARRSRGNRILAKCDPFSGFLSFLFLHRFFSHFYLNNLTIK